MYPLHQHLALVQPLALVQHLAANAVLTLPAMDQTYVILLDAVREQIAAAH